jgi:hypothetical protein
MFNEIMYIRDLLLNNIQVYPSSLQILTFILPKEGIKSWKGRKNKMSIFFYIYKLRTPPQKKFFVFLMSRLDCGVSQAARCWLLIAEVWVQSWFTSFGIHGGWSDIGAGFSPSFFRSPLLVIIRSMLYIDLLPQLWPGSTLSHTTSMCWRLHLCRSTWMVTE